MKYYLIALNNCVQLLKKRFRGRLLLDYARKENFDRIVEKGRWGEIYLGQTFERAYYSLFDEEKNFPGESFIRASRFKIPLNKYQTSFLARFMMQVNGRVMETNVKVSEKEKAGLLESLSGRGKIFRFYNVDGETIVVFSKTFPKERVSFPDNLQGERFTTHLYKNRGFEYINQLINMSSNILSSHPINKVREDLNELSANLLWLWGSGKRVEVLPFSKKIGKRVFYLPVAGSFLPPAELLGFKRVSSLSETEDNSFIWINVSIEAKEEPAIWVKHFESFDRDVLKNIFEEYNSGRCKVVFIFDGFFSPDVEVKNGRAVFLMLNGTPLSVFGLRKYFKNGRNFVEKFLA